MRLRQLRPHKTAQRGAALMVMLVIMVMGAAAFLLSSLNSSSQRTAHQETTAGVLAQAKDALIGRAASDDNMPGSLPCPDLITNNPGPSGVINVPNDGIADSLSVNDCPSYIGRLPWKTLGLPDLRDGAGERLWYVLSPNFRDDDSAQPLNSDTVGTLSVSGNIAANNVVAIVFAPGQTLPGQDRSIANTNSYSHYLESVVTEFTAFNLSTANDIRGGNYTYNDQLAFVTPNELFRTVEMAVGRRVRNLLNSSRAKLNAFPYATPFGDPSSSNFMATLGSYEGLLPAATAVWTSDPTFSLSGGSATVSCQRRDGNNSLANARARCDISAITSTPTITMSGTLSFRGLWSEYDLASSSEVRVRIKGTACSAPNPSSGSTTNCAAASIPGLNATINYSVNPDYTVTVTLTGTLSTTAITRIELRDLVLDSRYDWMTQNQWNRFMYYATSPGYAPSGSNTCNPRPASPSLPTSPSCLRVNDGSNFDDDVQALIVMTGSKLAGKTHPSNARTDYLEGENATSADFIYENQTRNSSFNDQVIIVAP